MPRVPRRESTGRVWPPSLLGSVQEVLPRQVLRSHVLGSRDAIGDRRPTRQPRIRHRPTENTYRGCYLPPTQQCDSNAPECDAAEGHANGVRRTFPPCRERRALRSLPGCPLGRGLPAFLPSARPRAHHSPLLSWPGTRAASDPQKTLQLSPADAATGPDRNAPTSPSPHFTQFYSSYLESTRESTSRFSLGRGRGGTAHAG